jgi:methylated-DNA-protein-cysteine methyltransferase-like protein
VNASYAAVYDMVCRVPSGQVTTYGRIAHLIGRPRAARQVGYALARLDNASAVPWHRVVNAQGKISPRRTGGCDELQRLLLEDEGVVFDGAGRIDLARFGWPGPEQRN